MKIIFYILLLTVSIYAKNLYYKNSEYCERDSISKLYFESCETKTEMPYTNGKINGIEKQYHKSGVLASITNYKNNIIIESKKCIDRHSSNEQLNCLRYY